MIGLPYPKLLNSNNSVDMAAAVIMCSVGAARRLGVPEDRWVFPHSGTDCREHQYVSHRDTFARTPAIEIGGRLALELAGIDIDDVSVIDLYSCFPAAVQLGAQSLGIDLATRQWSRTGGMTFAGGPWNNYVMHAIATVVNDLRERPGDHGLVWANGGFVTKHAFGVYSTTPPAGFRHDKPQPQIDALPRRDLALPADAAGPATVEAYTVMFDRGGQPERALATCLLADGRRAWGTSEADEVTSAMCDGEWVGRSVSLDPTGTCSSSRWRRCRRGCPGRGRCRRCSRTSPVLRQSVTRLGSAAIVGTRRRTPPSRRRPRPPIRPGRRPRSAGRRHRCRRARSAMRRRAVRVRSTRARRARSSSSARAARRANGPMTPSTNVSRSAAIDSGNASASACAADPTAGEATTSRRAAPTVSVPRLDTNASAWNEPANSPHARQNGSSLSMPGTPSSGTVAIVSVGVRGCGGAARCRRGGRDRRGDSECPGDSSAVMRNVGRCGSPQSTGLHHRRRCNLTNATTHESRRSPTLDRCSDLVRGAVDSSAQSGPRRALRRESAASTRPRDGHVSLIASMLACGRSMPCSGHDTARAARLRPRPRRRDGDRRRCPVRRPRRHHHGRGQRSARPHHAQRTRDA